VLEGAHPHPQLQEALGRIAQLEASLTTTCTTLARVTAERDKLRRAYEQLKEQLELLRRRIYIAKAERIDARQLEIEFEQTHQKLQALARELGDDASAPPPPPPPPDTKPRPKPKGRRDLTSLEMPEERLELLDPAREGKVERIGFEESCRVGYRRGGPVRWVVARATYKTEPPSEPGQDVKPVLVTVKKPKELVERGLLAPSMIAHVLCQKYRWGMPFHRLAKKFACDGFPLDDAMMGRYAEHVGASLGCIVEACAKEAKQTAFCLATDATGVCVQPEPAPGRQRQACRKGHFFVVLADKDHVFFEFQTKHTSAAVCEMFRGFSGYIQADAHAIYDAVFRGEARESEHDPPPKEVGCWSHCRRRAWEAAVVAKDPAAREALLRMRALFELEAQWADLAPASRHARRQLASRPLVDDFFTWAADQYARVKGTRGLVATAFGYAVRQEPALRRFLDDGRLPLTNNHSERALRNIAVGRRAWLFFGSDDHACAAANLFSLIASCELHRLDAEAYLLDIIHVLPYWPRDRYLELAPKYWTATRARISERELEIEVGDITVPPPLPPPEQTASR
jgi:transposase